MAYPINYKSFNSEDAKLTNKLVDYYEGDQLRYVVQMLDGKMNGYGKRTEWKTRGMVPRMRNITKSIVDRSGLLYNKPPKLSIEIPGSGKKPIVDAVFNALMDAADWKEVFQNVDVYTRLCKSIVVLQQKYIPTDTTTVNGQYRFDANNGDALLITLLHQGNSVVLTNPQRTRITALAFITTPDQDADSDYDYSQCSDDCWFYRLITEEEIVDFIVDEDAEETEIVVSRQPNPEGFVPASFFYDINKPRVGAWCEPPEDIVSFQEMYNLHITDQELAVAWQKQKTMIVNGDLIVDKNNGGSPMIPTAPMGHTDGGQVYNDLPVAQSSGAVCVGGLGSIIKLTPDDAGNPGKVEFAGPETDLQKLTLIMESMVTSIANDWDVNLNYGGGGKATSGFQLIVEELNNLNLREKRSQSAAAGMRRFYEITKQLYDGQLIDGQLLVEFAPPALPVNMQEKEMVWDEKIAGSRATPIDYFMEEYGMTKDEAMAKLKDTLAINKLVAESTNPVVGPGPEAKPKPVNPAQAGGNPADPVA